MSDRKTALLVDRLTKVYADSTHALEEKQYTNPHVFDLLFALQDAFPNAGANGRLSVLPRCDRPFCLLTG